MKFFLHVFFVVFPLLIVGQNKITVSKSEFLIGEQTTLYYEITNFKSDAIIDFSPWKKVIQCQKSGKDSLAKELEILFFRDTIIRENRSEWIGAYTLTAWDTGVYVIPQHSVWIDDEKFFFDAVRLHVFLPVIRDDVEIIETELPFQDYKVDSFYALKEYLPWILGILIVLIFVVWYLVKRNKQKQVKAVPQIPLVERTILALELLASKKLIEQHRVKEQYIESSFILRQFLSEEFDLNVLEKTSSQTRILLIAKGIPSELILDLQVLFNLFDSVKFASFNPDVAESQEILDQVKACVLKINNWAINHV